jgi:hypothetical protein
MSRRFEFIIAALAGLLLGAGLSFFLNGPSLLMMIQPDKTSMAYTPVVSDTASACDTPIPTSTSVELSSIAESDSISVANPAVTVTELLPTATPTRLPLQVGSSWRDDMDDVVLLYDAARISNFDVNFCKIAEYYGALCRKVALNTTNLTLELFQDSGGEALSLIGISAGTLLRDSPMLVTGEELKILKTTIEVSGTNLLVSDLQYVFSDSVRLLSLTNGALSGATKPEDAQRDWFISSLAPEITREFTGRIITATLTEPQEGLALVLSGREPVTTLISSQDDSGAAYPIFARLKIGAGSVFANSGELAYSLDESALKDLYYDWDFYSLASLVPLMMTMRYSLGNEAWHNDHNYANLTIDDPALTEPWRKLSYTELLREMEAHDFHTTIAMHPVTWQRSEPEVVTLFLEHPDRYSLVQHGNNGDGYEFYKYNVSEDDEYNGHKLPARPLAEQEMDIVEGMARMTEHRKLTGIPDDRIMIFPFGISPEPTLVLLKRYNYLATINAQEIPLDADRPSDWDYGMYQAVMDFASFPSLPRWCFQTYQEFRPLHRLFIFDLFMDKPALFCTHAYERDDFGKGNVGAFNPIADQVNAVTGAVEWRSLGDILRHLYLEKLNDDGSVDVKMYGNHVIIANGYDDMRTFHIAKVETLNVPISRLTVNGHEFPYRVEDGLLILDVQVPANSSVEIRILYGTE